MKKQSRVTKKGCTAILLRDVPNELHGKMKALAEKRGTTLRSLILTVMEAEVEKHQL